MTSNKTEPSNPVDTDNTWQWSITRRLVISYTLSAFIMLAVTAVFVNWTTHDTLIRSENDHMNDRIRVFRAIIESRPDFVDVIRHDLEWEGAYVTHPEYYARILDARCNTLVETSRMEEFIPNQHFPVQCNEGKVVQQQGRPVKTM